MKYLSSILVFLFIVSCTKTENDSVLGSWEYRNYNKKRGVNWIGKYTFHEGDSMLLEIFKNNKPFKKVHGQYKFDKSAKLLKTHLMEYRTKFNIIKMSNSEMILLNPEKGTRDTLRSLE